MTLRADYWTDIEGNIWPLERMDPQHQINVLQFIRERSLAFYLADQIQDELFDPFEPETIPGPELQLYIDMEASVLKHLGLLEDTREEAREWVEEQPLVKRLKELTNEQARKGFVQRWKARKAK